MLQSVGNSHKVRALGVGGTLVLETIGHHQSVLVESCFLRIVLQILESQTVLVGSYHFQTGFAVEH